jgi:hypothetical protein
MTLAISTSSPLISVTVFSGCDVLYSQSELAQQNASGLVASWVSEAVTDFSSIEKIVVDIGPGGFTGLKVGVTMAQMFAFVHDIAVYSITAFDLIAADKHVAIPYKKGSYCIRIIGNNPTISNDLSSSQYCGYGIEGKAVIYPKLDYEIIERCSVRTELDRLVPLYVAEPSISIPKQPFAST